MKAQNLDDLAKQLAKLLPDIVVGNEDIMKVIAKTESDSVYENVYDKYTPTKYQRRGAKGGLADPDNMNLTYVQSGNFGVYMEFENRTKGVDTMKDKDIADTIIEGIEENWEQPGEWSKPRDFITPAIEKLKEGTELRQAVVNSLKKNGLDAK